MNLNKVNYRTIYPDAQIPAKENQMFTSRFPAKVFTFLTILLMILGNVQPAYAAPTNDNFADATLIASLPFEVDIDTTGATFEVDEPYPSCGSGDPVKTVWFTYVPTTNVTITPKANYDGVFPILAIYSGSSLNSLSEIRCLHYYEIFALLAQPGVTYYFQLSGDYGNEGTILFSLQVTPPPQVNTYYSPSDPSIFDNVVFSATAYDPGDIGIASFAWSISDGATSDQLYFSHQFAVDGDYTATFTATSYDGRSGSRTQVVQVRTRDVAINKFGIPQTARVNQTKTIDVDVKNSRYSDYVQVILSKGLPEGYEQVIGMLTLYVPARATRPTTFRFSYTFTQEDASLGKVAFKATASIVNGRDALPSDNTALGTTLITK